MSFFIFIFILFLGWMGYLAILNQSIVLFSLTPQTEYHLPVFALILFSAIGGGLWVFLIMGITHLRGLLVKWKTSRFQKKKTEIVIFSKQAMGALLAQRYRDARLLLQKILAIDPNHVESHLRLGQIERSEKNYPEAIRWHQQAQSLDKENIEILLALAYDFEEALRFDEEIVILREILHLDSDNLTAWVCLRDTYTRVKQWEAAHTAQEKIVKRSPPADQEKERRVLCGIKYELGNHCLQKDQHDLARRYFKGAIKLDKYFIPAYVGLGNVNIKEGHSPLAASLWEKGYEITQNFVLLHQLENLSVQMGEPERIIRFYQHGIEKRQNAWALKFYLGKLYYRLEMLEAALELLTEVESKVSSFPALYKILGNLYTQRGEMESAVNAFKKCLSLKKQVSVQYDCTGCHYQTVEWAGRCVRCGIWNSFLADTICSEKPSPNDLSLPYSTFYAETGSLSTP